MLAPPVCLGERGISIHAPREGSDACKTTFPGDFDISIHAPREGSDSARCYSKRFSRRAFLSTLPVRGATHPTRALLAALAISIHAPREGSDKETQEV